MAANDCAAVSSLRCWIKGSLRSKFSYESYCYIAEIRSGRIQIRQFDMTSSDSLHLHYIHSPLRLASWMLKSFPLHEIKFSICIRFQFADVVHPKTVFSFVAFVLIRTWRPLAIKKKKNDQVGDSVVLGRFFVISVKNSCYNPTLCFSLFNCLIVISSNNWAIEMPLLSSTVPGSPADPMSETLANLCSKTQRHYNCHGESFYEVRDCIKRTANSMFKSFDSCDIVI